MYNITLKKLLSYNNVKDIKKYIEYLTVFEYVRAKDEYKSVKGKKIEQMTYANVMRCKKATVKDDFYTLFNLFFDVKKEDVEVMKVTEFFPLLNYIKKELERLKKMEKNLEADDNSDLINAGIEELSKFGALNPLVSIGEKFSKMPHELEGLTYSYIFSLLYQAKVSSDIEKRYHKIITKK